MPTADARGAPLAIQVADRWQLWHNLGEAVEQGDRQAPVLGPPIREQDHEPAIPLNASRRGARHAIITCVVTANHRDDPAHVMPLAATSPTATDENEHAKLSTALDHAWRWFELRIGHGMQMLNFAVVAFALLSAAYVSALSDKLYSVAGAVALLAAAVATTANLTARRQRQIAWIAAEPIREIQRRLAEDLGIDSLRILDRSPAAQSRWRSAMWLAAILHTLVLATCLTAAAAAWFWLR